MTTLNLFYNIKEAFETSTKNTNRFQQVLNSIKWESIFFADEEYYFIKDELTFTTPSLDPFDMPWNPSAMFADGSMLSF